MAYKKAVKGKHDRSEVIDFKASFEKNIEKLRLDLLKRKPDVGHYYFFRVHDPKPRDICAASFPERVLHHAMMNICEPVFEQYAIYDSYACRKNKGSHAAINRAQKFCRINAWYLKLDIRKYFDSIDHLTVIDMLARKMKDQDVLDLFAIILDTYQTKSGKGLPIGNLISQHLANFYLGKFDHWIKEIMKVKHYIRYMDDFILLSNSQCELKKLLDNIIVFLDNHLLLKLKENIQLNKVKHGIPFLGYRVFSEKILLSPQSRIRFIEKYRLYEAKCLHGTWSIDEMVRHMMPLIEFTKKADAHGLRTNVINRFGVWS
ncbi:MAG: group II intron reverse transcriptase domain-containing protein [Candidatus Magnetomorum sp.]|nr:group II intron reverse transcriptase domain-containing protein [Candidatus Magnetomorum sp.]